MTDDSGLFTDGSVVDEAFIDQIYDQIDDQAHSTTNPTVKPKAITDEVVAARGSKASLDARLDVSLNENGTLKGSASLVSVGTAATLVFRNLVPNGDFLLWGQGDAAAPCYWTLSGDGGFAVARTGTGLGDTTRPGTYGDFAAKLTYGTSAPTSLTHTLLSSDEWVRAENLEGRTVSAMVWVQSDVADIARIVITDGASTTTSDFHTGSGDPEMLTLSHVISESANALAVKIEVVGAGSAHFQDVCVVLADLPPDDYIPCEMKRDTIHFSIAGALGAGAKQRVFAPVAPGIVTDVQLRVETAPTSTSFIVDVNTWDGAAFTTMFSTKPTVAVGAFQGGAAPDATYARRCFRPLFGDTLTAGVLLSVDVDQVGGIGTPADAIIEVRVRQYVRPFEGIYAFGTIGE